MTLVLSADPSSVLPGRHLPVPAMAMQTSRATISIECEGEGDVAAREHLLDRAFGPARFRKTCQTLRAGRLPAPGLSLIARFDGKLVGTVRLWHVQAGGVPALMLGPLAVDSTVRLHGLGAMLMRDAIDRATALGHTAILLVGDAPYYARFGFERRHTLGLRMPGPVEEARFLGLELRPGAFESAEGLVWATGALDITARRRGGRARLRHAA